MISELLASPPQREAITQGGARAPRSDDVAPLVKGAQEGDAASLAGLYERFYAKIFRYVSFKVGDAQESEDITEDVFLKMLESIHSFKWQGYPFTSWLFRIAHNQIVDHFRRKSRRKSVPLDDVVGLARATFYDMDGSLDVQLSMRQVRGALVRLTDLQKEVLNLRFAVGLSVMETAQAMGKKENAVKALQHAAIKKLRLVLGGRPEGPGRPAGEWST